MQQIKVSVYVSLATAIGEKRSTYGSSKVALNDEDMARLSDEARSRLRLFEGDSVGVYNGNSTRPVEVVRPDVEGTIAGIEAAVTTIRVQQEKEAAEREQRIQRAVAATDDDWIDYSSNSEYYTNESGEYSPDRSGRWHGKPIVASSPKGMYLPSDERQDPRVQARIAAIDLSARQAEHARRVAEWQAVVAEASVRKQEREAAWAETCRQYVIAHVPEYARAAREGCDVRSIAMRVSEQALRELVATVGDVVEIYASVDVHPRPHQCAYEKLDRVRELLEHASGEESSMSVDMRLVESYETQIVRGDTCPERECQAGLRTLVEVTAHYRGGGILGLYVYADAADAHEHQDENEES